MTQPRIKRRCCVLWIVGALGLVFGHYCLYARVDPYFSAVYTFLWWPAIFVVDALVFLLRGRSLLHDRPREFVLLALWSTPVWLLFEALNLRIDNWYYIQVPIIPRLEGWLLLPAFATVLPGIFEVMELVVGLIERATGGRGIRGRPFTVTPKHINIQILIGVAMLVLVLAFPSTCFSLAWGFAFFILDPICCKRGGRSLLGQLARGDNTRFLALLAAGVLCGGLWEFWNIAARSKWIYTVPGFEQLKLGEMPLLGFMGFPPFALECYAIVNTISLFRGGRNWELAPDESARLRGMSWPAALPAWCLAGTLSVLVLLAVFAHSVSSFSLSLPDVFARELAPPGVAVLQSQASTYPHQFLERWDDSPAPPEIDPALFERIRALCAMSEFKGIGLAHALTLERIGIAAPPDLAGRNPVTLASSMGDAVRRPPPPPARVRVWIDAADRRYASGR